MLVSRAGLSPVMVGRDSEFGALRRLAATVTPTIALIGGEPGIGKTRLASELVDAVPPATRVLLSQADPGAAGQPYRLLLELVGAAGEEPVTTAIAQLRGGDRLARPAAAVALLRALVGEGPALLVVDDLHWADPESLAVFEHLEEVTTGQLLLLGTYRPEELSRRHPLAALLERLDRRRGVTHLRLARLTPADTAHFLTAVYGRPPARHTVTALHHRTGGNPFFLEELLKAAGDTDLDQLHDQPLPWNLAEALRSQLDGLAPAHRQVVEAAAVLGARVSFDLLATVTGLDEPAMLDALRELVNRGLLLEAEDDQFGFRHTLTREAVAGELLARQRRRLHEAALEALLADPAPDLAAVAIHARGAGRYDDLLDAARRGAAERLAAGSAYAALILAELALAEAPDDLPLLGLATTAAWRAGYTADGRRHATRALRAASDDAERVTALAQLIRVSWEARELAEMDHHTEQVRELVPTLPDWEVRARAMAALAQSYMLRGRSAEAVEWADRACEAADRHGLKDVRLSALVEKGSALVCQAETTDAGRALLAEVATEAEHAGAQLEAARAAYNLFWYLPPGDPSAPDVLERARINSERAGVAGMALSGYHDGRARLAILAGDLAEAVAVLERGQRLSWQSSTSDPVIDTPPPPMLGATKGIYLRAQLAQLYLEQGRLDAAEALFSGATTTDRWRAAIAGVSFQIACYRGELATARELLAQLVEPAEQFGLEALHGQISAGLAVGLPANALAPLATRLHGKFGHRGKHHPDHPLRQLVEAQLAEARHRYQEAFAGYQAATQSSASSPLVPAHRGTAAIGAARCLIQLGRLAEAREQLAVAEQALANWAGWRCRELVALRRRLSAGDDPAAPLLTPREQEVAALVAEGLTNAEIARRLVISRKTVAVHVSHILAKLEMSSRSQVAAWVARTGAR